MLVIGILLCLFVVNRSFCWIDWVLDVPILVSKTDLLECVFFGMIDELCVKETTNEGEEEEELLV